MILSDNYANNYLNFLLGNVATLTAPTQVWLGLSSNNPEGEDGIFTELAGGNYSRVLVKIRGESYPDVLGTASDRSITNVKQITWNKASDAWLNGLGVGFFTAETGGTPFAYGKLDQELVTPAGAVALLEPGAFEIFIPEYSASAEDSAV